MHHALQFAGSCVFPILIGFIPFRTSRPKLTSAGLWKKVGCEFIFETMRGFVCLKLGIENSAQQRFFRICEKRCPHIDA